MRLLGTMFFPLSCGPWRVAGPPHPSALRHMRKGSSVCPGGEISEMAPLLPPLLQVLSDVAAAPVEMTEREIHEQTKTPEMSLPAGRG